MIRTMIAAAALMLAPAVAHAQTPEQAEAIGLSLARGKLIYAYDQAAWHGTDDMVKKLPDYADTLGGWIVDGPAETPTLIFFDRDKADPKPLYIAQFRGNRLTSSRVLKAGEMTLSPARKAMIAVRQKGIAAWVDIKPLHCAESSPNTVVLPPERQDGPFLVYVLTPQVKAGSYPMGGHFRIEIEADGTVGPGRPFSRSCLELGGGAGEPGEKPEAMFVTHLLDPTPTEIHVFTALTSGIPIAVSTDETAIWWVTGSAITGMPINR